MTEHPREGEAGGEVAFIVVQQLLEVRWNVRWEILLVGACVSFIV